MENTTKTPEELSQEAEAKKVADAKKVQELKSKAEAKKVADAKKVEDKKVADAKKAEAKKVAEDKKVTDKKVVVVKKEKEVEVEKVVLINVLGKEVPCEDYFFKGIVPPGFKGTCGRAVDREDLVDLFHKVFKPSDNVLFYRQLDKEVYIVIIPIKYSTAIGDFNDSIDGDFQKHAISFLNEGSVNLDTMRKKLERINNFVNYSDR
ncbi:MAG: hypothetical protein KAS32_24960 [Candidatus Peribacteraceae bacterium]|nr:hypothetical protein [Candidatus Peribacteraceae bacterium]